MSESDELNIIDDNTTPLIDYTNNGILSSDGDDDVQFFDRKKTHNKHRNTTGLIILCVLLAVALLAVTLVWVTGDKSISEHKVKRDHTSFKQFIQLSDTHLDIYFHSNVTNQHNQMCRNKKLTLRNSSKIINSSTTALFGRIKCDPPEFLLKSLKSYLRNVREEIQNGLEFILVTGDQSAHDYNYFEVNLLDSLIWSISNSTKYIADSFPGIPIFMTVGNNDLYGDYLPPVHNFSSYFQTLYHIFQPYVFREGSDVNILNSKEEFRKTFELGGYYRINLDGGRIVLVALNSNYWSAKAYSENSNITMIGDMQMKWFSYQLKLAKSKQQKVIITGHIPPGNSAYDKTNLWLQNYTNYYNLMVTANFSDVIMAQIYGHSHSDSFKVQLLKDAYPAGKSPNKSYVLLCPSVTPIFGNNPAFRVYDYDDNKCQLVDYTQYYLDLAMSNVRRKAFWMKEYSFLDTYNVELTTHGVETIINEFLVPSSSIWFTYLQHIKAKFGGLYDNERFVEYCAAQHVTLHAFKACLKAFEDVGI